MKFYRCHKNSLLSTSACSSFDWYTVPIRSRIKVILDDDELRFRSGLYNTYIDEVSQYKDKEMTTVIFSVHGINPHCMCIGMPCQLCYFSPYSL